MLEPSNHSNAGGFKLRADAINLVVFGMLWVTISTAAAPSQKSDDLPSVLVHAQKSFDSNASNGSYTGDENGTSYQNQNYCSEKYHIQFQYPPGWTVKEKTNRSEVGYDINISPANRDVAIGISHYADLIDAFGTTDLDSAIFGWVKNMQLRDFSREYLTMESPSYLNIDGVRTGTVVYTSKERYGNDLGIGIASQIWIALIGKNGYLISFMANADQFDSPENIIDRDQFINSIHFLDRSSNKPTGTEPDPICTKLNLSNCFHRYQEIKDHNNGFWIWDGPPLL